MLSSFADGSLDVLRSGERYTASVRFLRIGTAFSENRDDLGVILLGMLDVEPATQIAIRIGQERTKGWRVPDVEVDAIARRGELLYIDVDLCRIHRLVD